MLYDESRHSVHVCFKQLHTKCSKCSDQISWNSWTGSNKRRVDRHGHVTSPLRFFVASCCSTIQKNSEIVSIGFINLTFDFAYILLLGLASARKLWDTFVSLLVLVQSI